MARIWLPGDSIFARSLRGWPSSPAEKPTIPVRVREEYRNDSVFFFGEGSGDVTRELTTGREIYLARDTSNTDGVVSIARGGDRPDWVIDQGNVGINVDQYSSVGDHLIGPDGADSFFNAHSGKNITVEVAVSFDNVADTIEPGENYDDTYVLFCEGRNSFVVSLLYYRDVDDSGRGLEFWVQNQASSTGKVDLTVADWRPTANTVHVIRGTWDGTTIRLHIDGVLFGSTSFSGTSVRDNGASYWAFGSLPYYGSVTGERVFDGTFYYARLAYRTDNKPLTRNTLWERVFEPANQTPFLIGTAAAGGTDNLLADNVESASEVSSPALGQVQVLLADNVESASEVSSPALGQAHVLLADNVESASELTAPVLTESTADHNLLADNVESASEVSSPTIGQTHVLTALNLECASEISAPAISGTHTLLADNVESASELTAPGLTSGAVTNAQIWAKLCEVHQILGLDADNPMTVTPTSRISGDISQTISGDGVTSTTVTRDP